MKYLLFNSLVFLMASTGAFAEMLANTLVESIPVSVDIVRNQDSSQIAIESDRYAYRAIYRESALTFDDVVMLFQVKSPLSVQKRYSITLEHSFHACERNDIDVEVRLYDVVMEESDSTDWLDFTQDDGVDQWREHRFLLSFPELPTLDTEQSCYGRLVILAGLEV